MICSEVIGPIPPHFVNENRTDVTVGPQINRKSKISGIPTISPRTILSRRVRRLNRPCVRGTEAIAPGAPVDPAASGASSVVRSATKRGRSGRILGLRLLERVPEVLDLLLQGGDVLVRILEELEQERLHPVRPGEVRVGVAVEELGDALGLADDLGSLLLERRVLARVRVLGSRDVAEVRCEPGDLGVRLSEMLDERLRRVDVLRRLAQGEAVDRRVEGLLRVVLRPEGGVREEVQ